MCKLARIRDARLGPHDEDDHDERGRDGDEGHAGALQAVLTTETTLGWAAPLVHIGVLAVIGVARRGRRWRRRG